MKIAYLGYIWDENILWFFPIGIHDLKLVPKVRECCAADTTHITRYKLSIKVGHGYIRSIEMLKAGHIYSMSLEMLTKIGHVFYYTTIVCHLKC